MFKILYLKALQKIRIFTKKEQLHRIVFEMKSLFRKYPFQSIMTSSLLVLCLLFCIIPKHGKILPVDPYMVNAYLIMEKTKTGKQLIKRVKKTTAGAYIYLSLGSTEKDQLFDYYGEAVRGVTRATFEYCDQFSFPKSVTVITNRDLVGIAPRDIIRSIAFELENVDYVFKNPQLDFPGDSPLALATQQKIMDELDL